MKSSCQSPLSSHSRPPRRWGRKAIGFREAGGSRRCFSAAEGAGVAGFSAARVTALFVGLVLAALTAGPTAVLAAIPKSGPESGIQAEQDSGDASARLVRWSDEKKRPNIVLILADDLGYGDLGCYGQEKIRTPNIDRLAAEGMRFTRFYCGAPVCAPSRCVLLTGKHLGHAAIRDNSEVQPEGQLPLPAEEATLGELLQAAGYRTAAIGKWGLGPPNSSGDPNRQGFDLFFGYNCQRHAHNYYPSYLYRNAERIALDNPPFAAHQKFPADADPQDSRVFAQYQGSDYAPDLMLEEAVRFIRDHRDQPFFLYFASPIPHLALQVPESSLAEYLGQFPETPYLGGKGYLPHRAPRACLAAMISHLDRQVGRIMETLDELGLADDTLILFTSDNGPPEDVGGADTQFFNSNGSLRGFKGSVFEGGVRVPLVARWPGRIPTGTISSRIAIFYDLLPTLMEAIHRPTPSDCDGISFLPTLLGEEQPRQRDFILYEFYGYGGQQAVRMGRWKGVRQNCYRKPDGPLMLFDLEADPNETTDISAAHPDVVVRMEEILRAEHQDHPYWDFTGNRRPPRPAAAAR